MNKNNNNAVKIAEFKSHLSQYIKNVRNGHPITLFERETPVARIVPYPSKSGKLIIRKPGHGINELRLPPPLKKSVNSLKVLMEERQSGR